MFGVRDTYYEFDDDNDDIRISQICLETYPCKHGVIITNDDGTTQTTIKYGDEILKMLKLRNITDIPQHFKDYENYTPPQRHTTTTKTKIPKAEFYSIIGMGCCVININKKCGHHVSIMKDGLQTDEMHADADDIVKLLRSHGIENKDIPDHFQHIISTPRVIYD